MAIAEALWDERSRARGRIFARAETLHTARGIQSCYDVPQRDRQAATCLVAEAILPAA